MANTVKMKRSAVPLKVPATTDLDLGEIAINTFDGIAYIKKDILGVQTVVPLGGGTGTVTNVSVVSANGFAGTVATATTTPAITLTTSITGLVKGNGTAISAAVSGTDYAPATSGSSILYGNGTGGFSAVTIGTGLSFTTGTLSATNAGTVTSVTATSPVASTGGATPVISMPAATTSVSGYLTSADWNTFNSKGSGTVTSVTGTAPIVSSGGATPAISLANTAVTAGSYTYASITVDSQGRLTAASNGASPSAFPAGTAMLFVQTSAPIGWTKSTAHDNKALRIVSGTASSGGSVAFTTAFASQTPSGTVSVSVSAGTLAVGAGTFAVSPTTLALTQVASHSHNLTVYTTIPKSGSTSGIAYNTPKSNATTVGTDSQGGGGSHTHTLSGAPSLSGSPSVTASSFTGTAINLAVQYVDVIIATKD